MKILVNYTTDYKIWATHPTALHLIFTYLMEMVVIQLRNQTKLSSLAIVI